MDEKTTSAPRRQAVVDDSPEAPGMPEMLGAPHAEKPSAPETFAVVHPEPVPSPIDIFKAALLSALDDPAVIRKLAEHFSEWTELRPDAFRNPTRWQQRAGR